MHALRDARGSIGEGQRPVKFSGFVRALLPFDFRPPRVNEVTMRNVVILGGGTVGTMMANRLVKHLHPEEWTVTVVDRDDVHVYQPALLFIPFGTYNR